MVPAKYASMLEHTKNPNEAFSNATELAAIGDWRQADVWHKFGLWWLKNPSAKEYSITVGVTNA